jgi:hypothetical protein
LPVSIYICVTRYVPFSCYPRDFADDHRELCHGETCIECRRRTWFSKKLLKNVIGSFHVKHPGETRNAWRYMEVRPEFLAAAFDTSHERSV